MAGDTTAEQTVVANVGAALGGAVLAPRLVSLAKPAAERARSLIAGHLRLSAMQDAKKLGGRYVRRVSTFGISQAPIKEAASAIVARQSRLFGHIGKLGVLGLASGAGFVAGGILGDLIGDRAAAKARSAVTGEETKPYRSISLGGMLGGLGAGMALQLATGTRRSLRYAPVKRLLLGSLAGGTAGAAGEFLGNHADRKTSLTDGAVTLLEHGKSSSDGLSEAEHQQRIAASRASAAARRKGAAEKADDQQELQKFMPLIMGAARVIAPLLMRYGVSAFNAARATGSAVGAGVNTVRAGVTATRAGVTAVRAAGAARVTSAGRAVAATRAGSAAIKAGKAVAASPVGRAGAAVGRGAWKAGKVGAKVAGHATNAAMVYDVGSTIYGALTEKQHQQRVAAARSSADKRRGHHETDYVGKVDAGDLAKSIVERVWPSVKASGIAGKFLGDRVARSVAPRVAERYVASQTGKVSTAIVKLPSYAVPKDLKAEIVARARASYTANAAAVGGRVARRVGAKAKRVGTRAAKLVIRGLRIGSTASNVIGLVRAAGQLSEAQHQQRVDAAKASAEARRKQPA